MTRCGLVVTVAGCLAFACSSESNFALNQAAAVTATVSVSSGGTLSSSTGDTLTIPPGALAQDTTITMTPLDLPASARDFLGGAMFAPDGLRFSQPATLTLKLASSQTPGLELMMAESVEAGTPTRFGTGDVLFTVDASGTSATGTILGFSGKAVEKNCHAGTRDALIAGWQGKAGRDLVTLSQDSGVAAGDLQSCSLGADPLQKLVKPFFEPCAEFTPDQPFTQQAKDLIATRLAAGRQVVFLFGQSLTINSAGERDNLAHSAVAVSEGGRILIRNQVYITNPQTLADLQAAGGSTTVDLPLDDIDKTGEGERDKRAGEVYRTLTNKPYTPEQRAQQPRAWPHVVVLCEKEGAGAGTDGGVDGMMSCTPMTKIGMCPGELNCPQTDAPCACPTGSEFCCDAINGDRCYSRDVAGCIQTKCPPGSGRNYSDVCVCPDGTHKVSDPCDGVALRCDPN